MQSTALLLAAHGSLKDPLSSALVRGQAERIRTLGIFEEVAVAFLKGSPGFDSALDSLECKRVIVVPFMTSVGHTSRIVLPRELAKNRRYAEKDVTITPPVGTHPGAAQLVARRAQSLLDHFGFARRETTIAIIGHGTPRHPESRKATETVVQALREVEAFPEVLAAFLDEQPGVEQVLARSTRPQILVVPFLIASGQHATEDIPRRLGLATSAEASRELSGEADFAGLSGEADFPMLGRVGERTVVCDAPVGGDPGIRDIILELAAGDQALRGRPVLSRGGQTRSEGGRVYLVGAGPGDPELITVRGLRLLRQADVIVHDRLVAPELLNEARVDAELLHVGKMRGAQACSQEATQQLLVDRALQGKLVVRLKGGDPFVFGRGGEEVAACRAAGVPCDVIPGVSSVTAVPAAAGIPVTLRGTSNSFAAITASTRASRDLSEAQARSLAGMDTVVILMGRANLTESLEKLIAGGKSPETPAATIERGTTSRQRVVVATLATLAEKVRVLGMEAPVTTVVGEVARQVLEGSVPASQAPSAKEAIHETEKLDSWKPYVEASPRL